MTATSRIGVVLSSGGVRGVYAHTGFMQALQALNIPIHASVGCSAGALVGGFLASGTPLETWHEHLKTVDSRSFWTPDSTLGFLWKMAAHKGRGYTGLSDTSAATAFTRENLSVQRFEACLYPFQTLAVNLNTGQKVMFSSGELAPRMVASAAIPILFQPQRIDDAYYCDGALVDFAPTDAICCMYDLDVVIVHHVAQGFGDKLDIEEAFGDSWAMLEIINRVMFREKPWYLNDELVSLHRCPCGCGAVIVVVQPDLPVMSWPTTDGGDAVMQSTYKQAMAILTPYVEQLLTNPRDGLPILKGSVQHPAAGCGHTS